MPRSASYAQRSELCLAQQATLSVASYAKLVKIV
nr:MAG TPA: hypothetical protein [Caudoviricetes sp.]